MSALTELEESIQAAADGTGPAVVGIGGGWRGGSGVVVRPGLILTSAHNLRHDEVTVVFSDGRQETGSVAGSDPDLGLAAVEVDTSEVAPIRWEPSQAEARIGRAVFALANPGGRGLRVTPGVVSSTTRSFRGARGRRISRAVERSAPLPGGASGGPRAGAGGY